MVCNQFSSNSSHFFDAIFHNIFVPFVLFSSLSPTKIQLFSKQNNYCSEETSLDEDIGFLSPISDFITQVHNL